VPSYKKHRDNFTFTFYLRKPVYEFLPLKLA